jgi:regulator of sigma E protease
VNEFAMGMGPAIFKFGKKETKYAVRALPFGGSVLMEGENGDSEDPRAFNQKPKWQRFLILFGGAAVNLLCGLLIMAVILSQQDLIGTNRIHSFDENAVSQANGLQAGDVIYKIGGKRVISSSDLGFLLSRSADGVVDLVVIRDGKKLALDQFPFQTEPGEGGRNWIVRDFVLVGVKPTFSSVVSHTVLESASLARMVWLSLLDMVTGHFKLSEISGPVGVVNLIQSQANVAAQSDTPKETHEAFLNLLYLFSLISINIGVMNLLPVPALDGGRLFFLLVEMIVRRPIPKKLEAWVHGVGLLLLLSFMVVITFSDIWGWAHGK